MDRLIFSEDLCRLCLWRSNKLLPIFSEEGELQGIPAKIGICLPVSVSRDDPLPKLICNRCIYKLEMFSEFRNSSKRSEHLLKRYMVSQNTPSTQSQQAETSQSVPLLQPDIVDVKLEIADTESVAVIDENSAYICFAPEPAMEEPQTPALQLTEDPLLHTPIIESVNNISENAVLQDKPAKPSTSGRKRKAHNKPLSREEPLNGESSAVMGRRHIHNCKYCSKTFASRLLLSKHLTSSSCLFRYTCRYCAKIFVSAENRLLHERNHKDKKNFICAICKQEFQSTFELNVHAVQGCERPMLNSPRLNKKKRTDKVKTKVTAQNGNPGLGSKVQTYSCFTCNKTFRKKTQHQRHVRSCTPSVGVSGTHRNHVRKPEDSKVQVEKTVRMPPQGMRTRNPLRRMQNSLPIEDPPVVDNPNISPQASLLAVLGLKEKSTPPKTKEEPQMDVDLENSGRCSPDVIVVKEVVTVCDICKKIFTSESGMLNHQNTAHNRNMTAEKMIHTVIRVDVE